jgi:hypothetical protein
MSEIIVLELPEEILLKALRQLSPDRRRWLFNQIDVHTTTPRGVSALELDAWTGLIAVGGDALTESEQLYDD